MYEIEKPEEVAHGILEVKRNLEITVKTMEEFAGPEEDWNSQKREKFEACMTSIKYDIGLLDKYAKESMLSVHDGKTVLYIIGKRLRSIAGDLLILDEVTRKIRR